MQDTLLDTRARVSQRFLTGTPAGAVTRTYGYDGYGRLNRLTTATSSAVLRDDVYSFNDSGTVRAVADVSAGVGQGECFEYDQRNRLIHASTSTSFTQTSGASPGGWANEHITCGAANAAEPAPYDEGSDYDAGTRMTERGSSTYSTVVGAPRPVVESTFN